ncbi:bifunctional 2-polyprenyl-6-hydroxyphenol methylase/3-demethylubiquinol 3-O-methyltransferase UbiG [Occultella aeris]|uniref:Ubiquinone biosynthesis O-methyltransferase n=1 Tax=Occultella aeris TaxID=2761496 RepID=A0A7M4DJM7_9MICO|nr:class I SAM-dependent methyltransferase [Occultella aeris]VZO37247.1 Ubiquinone biosynthesis O-methyltransferase [Occultella aeris]
MTDGEDPPGCCFDDWARSESRRARRVGADGVTSALLDGLARVGLTGRSVLDIGAGAGTLVVGALERGAARATGFDLGPGAVEAARGLAAERGFAAKARFEVGDGSVADLPPSDLVTLNRVICCYPDPGPLVDHTVAAAGRGYAFVLPRSTGPMGLINRAVLRVGNLWFRARPGVYGGYRAFVHDVGPIHDRLVAAGFRRVHAEHLRLVWQLAVYARVEATH